MEKLILFQKRDNFIFTRKREVKEMSAAEVISSLHKAREQLKDMQDAMEEFKEDINTMEKMEPTAKRILEEEKKNRIRNQKHIG